MKPAPDTPEGLLSEARHLLQQTRPPVIWSKTLRPWMARFGRRVRLELTNSMKLRVVDPATGKVLAEGEPTGPALPWGKPTAPDPARTEHPYNGIAGQRAAILARLGKGPATGAQLQAECLAPDPTARISELRKAGHQIDTHMVDHVNPDGTVNRVGLYVLRATDTQQAELDLNT